MNIVPVIRSAILSNAYVTSRLDVWNGEPAVFTRSPIPSTMTVNGPAIMISPDITYDDQDFLKSKLSRIRRDIAVYGEVKRDYRIVEEIAYAIRDQFHRNNSALFNPDFHVVSINATGPISAPTDDKKVGRIVTLTIRIQ